MVLAEGTGQVAAQVVVGITGAQFQVLLLQVQGQTHTPLLRRSVAGAQAQARAVAIPGSSGLRSVEVHLAGRTGDEAAPLLERLPGAPVGPLLLPQAIPRTAQGRLGGLW
ncbi:hypothetical protein D3C84_988710 [compost metagenome]